MGWFTEEISVTGTCRFEEMKFALQIHTLLKGLKLFLGTRHVGKGIEPSQKLSPPCNCASQFVLLPELI